MATPATDLPEGFTVALCASVAAFAGRAVPVAVAATLETLLIDTVAVLLGARGAVGLDVLERRYRAWEPDGTATALLGGARLSPPTAALLNATAAHALDYDDQHDGARVHTYCVLFPTLLALAEQRRAEGRATRGPDFFRALAVGAELNARFGLACRHSLAHGWHPTMTFGTLSSAIAGAVLLDLDAARIGDALGLALHQASGSAQSARDGALSKRAGAGFAARAAVTSAALAADGITGTRRTLEGTAGLFALYERGNVEPALLTDALWQDWRIPEYSLKPYPCCRCTHAAIDLALQLRARRPVREIVGVTVQMGALNHLTVGAPYRNPDGDVVRAQFSAAYTVAASLLAGRPGLDHFRAPTLSDPSITALAQRVEVVVDPAIRSDDMESARLTIRYADGGLLDAETASASGSPARPLTSREQVLKFEDCVAAGFGAGVPAARALRERLQGLASSADIAGDLVAALDAVRAAAR